MVRGLVSPGRLLARLRPEGGFALPFALVTMLTTGALASSAIAYSSWNYGSTKRSDADQQAFALAEAGLNYAYSTLYNSGTPTMDSAVPQRTVTLTTAGESASIVDGFTVSPGQPAVSSVTPAFSGVERPRTQSGTIIQASNAAPMTASRAISSRMWSSENWRWWGTIARQFE